jgi:hypothetical protein
MGKIMNMVVAAVTLFVAFATLQVTPVQAQATRTWVSGVGDDANPCSRTAPCKTFAGAISKTTAGGEINVLDPGGFGAVTINKAISIISTSPQAGVLVSGTNGIVVSAGAADKIVLEGLDIEGLGTGLTGINIIGGGNITIRNSSIRNFTQNAISVAANMGGAGARAVIDNVLITGNTGGLNVAGNGPAVNAAILINSIVDHNTNYAVQVATGGQITLIGATLMNSNVSINYNGGGAVVSYGNNVIRNGGVPSSTATFQ